MSDMSWQEKEGTGGSQSFPNVRLKCEFDPNHPEFPCVYCEKHSLQNCYKVPSNSHQNPPGSIPSPPESTVGAPEFRLSEICAYYERMYQTATPRELLAHLQTHIEDQERKDAAEAAELQGRQAEAAMLAAYGPQTAMMVPSQPLPSYAYGATGYTQYQQPIQANIPPQIYIDPSLLIGQQTGQSYIQPAQYAPNGYYPTSS